MNLKQAKFLEAYKNHGDIARAYREAGYIGPANSAYRLLRTLSEPAPIVREPPKPDVRRMVPPPVTYSSGQEVKEHYRKLSTRQGRKEWLMDLMSGEMTIEKTVSYFDAEGNRQEETVVTVAEFKDRLKAAELLGKMDGDFTVKIDMDLAAKEAPRAVFVHVDNGRGPALPSAGSVSGNVPIDVCDTCSAAYDAGTYHHCTK